MLTSEEKAEIKGIFGINKKTIEIARSEARIDERGLKLCELGKQISGEEAKRIWESIEFEGGLDGFERKLDKVIKEVESLIERKQMGRKIK